MRKSKSAQNKTNLNRNNLKNHKTASEVHNINKEDFEEQYKNNIELLQELLVDENSIYETAGEVDLDFYLNWLENDWRD